MSFHAILVTTALPAFAARRPGGVVTPATPLAATPGKNEISPAAAELAKIDTSQVKIVDPARALEMNGVKSSPQDLIQFLKVGWSAGLPQPLPEEPAEKAQLAIDAMARLGKAGTKSAVPVLIEIASLRSPAGVEALVRYDLDHTAPASREEYRQKALHLLQYNAINAMGLIGDPSAQPVIAAVFNGETNPGARIAYAQALACVGDASGVPFLLEQIALMNRRESAGAARVFTTITGQDFNYTEDTPVAARRTRSRQYAQWWKDNGATFRIDPAAVMHRRVTPRVQVGYKARSTRDRLKVASYYLDTDNALNSREAREALRRGGAGQNADLERIASDRMEDLDVRMEAMNWYFDINREAARPLLQKLVRDENPEITVKAKTLMEQADDEASLKASINGSKR